MKEPKKNCKRCMGRGEIVVIVGKDKDGKDLKEKRTCICTQRISDNHWKK